MISYEKPNSGETLVYVSCSLILPESSKPGCFSSLHCSVSILTLCLSLCGDASHILKRAASTVLLTSSTVWKITQTVISIVGWDRSFLLGRGGFKLAIILPHLPGIGKLQNSSEKTGITCLPLCLVRFLEIYQEFQDPFSSYFACFYVFKTVSSPSGAGWTAQEENKVLGFDISWSCSSFKKMNEGQEKMSKWTKTLVTGTENVIGSADPKRREQMPVSCPLTSTWVHGIPTSVCTHTNK